MVFGVEHKVCKPRKALYGLKQALRVWSQKLQAALINFDFQVCKSDNSLYIQHLGTHITLVLVHVDDIIITGSSSTLVEGLIKYLRTQFAVKDLGQLS